MPQSHSFETDARGNLVGVPTNLKVDSAGNVFDGAGNYVGRAGEVYVDADGNAVNAAGQIVGYATAGGRAPVSTERPIAVPESSPAVPVAPVYREPEPIPVAPTVADYPAAASLEAKEPIVRESVIGEPIIRDSRPTGNPDLARHAAEVLSKSEFYRDARGELLGAPTNLTLDGNGMVRDALGNVVGKAGEVFLDAHGNAINAAGQIVGAATVSLASIIGASTGRHAKHYDTLPDIPSYQEGAVFPDGTEFAGQHFASEATEGLVPPHETQLGFGETTVEFEDVPMSNTYQAANTYETDAYQSEGTYQTEPHLALHNVPGETAPTNLFVDDDGNVTDAAGNYLGKAGEVVADSAGNVLNAAGEIVGSTTGPLNHGDHTYDEGEYHSTSELR